MSGVFLFFGVKEATENRIRIRRDVYSKECERRFELAFAPIRIDLAVCSEEMTKKGDKSRVFTGFCWLVGGKQRKWLLAISL